MQIDGDVRAWIQTALIAGLFLSAYRWGGGPEKALAWILAGMRLADSGYHLVADPHDPFVSAAVAHASLDIIAAVAALAVALNANRMYTLWFAAFQLLAVFAHLARDVARDVATLAYELMYVGPSYFQIILLAGGIWFHHRRVRRHGSYRPWRTSWPRSPEKPHRSWPSG